MGLAVQPWFCCGTGQAVDVCWRAEWVPGAVRGLLHGMDSVRGHMRRRSCGSCRETAAGEMGAAVRCSPAA
jgi:hypothetical protein